MKAHLVRFGVAVVAAVACIVGFVVVQHVMVTRPVPVLKTLVPAPDVAEARIVTRIISPAINLNLALSPNQRHISVVGHIHCDAGERVRINVDIAQAITGARASGHTQQVCTGAPQTWRVQAVARGPIRFVEGQAQACAVATTRQRNAITDTFSWCKTVNLVR